MRMKLFLNVGTGCLMLAAGLSLPQLVLAQVAALDTPTAESEPLAESSPLESETAEQEHGPGAIQAAPLLLPERQDSALFTPKEDSTLAQAASVGQAPSLTPLPETPEQLPFEPDRDLLQQRRSYTPSITILTPSGYGKSWGQASVGIGGQARTRFGNKADGAIGLGFGLGDARKAVGLDVSLAIVDLSGFERGLIGFKLHRLISDDLSVAIGVNDAIQWGNGDDAGMSPYGVVTKNFVLRDDPRDLLSNIYVSAGAGTGRYRTEFDIFTDDDSPAPFGSVAVRVAQPVNMIAEWSGQDLSLGVSILPFRRVPLVITPAITDITGNAGDGVRFIFSVGYGISF